MEGDGIHKDGIKYYPGTGVHYSEEQVKHMRYEIAEWCAKEEMDGELAMATMKSLFYDGFTGWRNMPIKDVIQVWENDLPPDEEYD